MSKKSSDSQILDFKAQMLLHNNINVNTRTVIFADVVSNKSFKNLVRGIDLLLTIALEPVNISLTTPGGDVYAMGAIMDYLMQLDVPLGIYAVGEVASAGIPIFACGDVRIAGQFTKFMIHPTSYEMSLGKVADHKVSLEEVKSSEYRINQFMAKRTLKPYQWWASAGKVSDLHIDSEEAVRIGLAHKIFVKGSNDTE